MRAPWLRWQQTALPDAFFEGYDFFRMLHNHADYRTYLKSLVGSHKKDPSRSLRRFAQKMGISNSHLSEVLKGKKNLSIRLAFKIAAKLNLTEFETNYFSLLVQVEQARDRESRNELLHKLRELGVSPPVHDLTADLFRTISDWYHFAILELSFLPGFKFTPEFIGRRLQIPTNQAKSAMERLIRIGLFTKLANGRYRKTHELVYTASPTRNEAFRQFHAQVLEKARESLSAEAPSRRISSSEFIPMDSRFLPEIDRLSREFSAAVLKYSEKSRLKDTVYGLAVHFFPVTSRNGDI